jgi:hypothetical protein
MGGGKKEREEAGPERLSPREDACLKAAKEIAVKFIETGRIGLAAFPEAFAQVYRGVKDAVDGKG